MFRTVFAISLSIGLAVIPYVAGQVTTTAICTTATWTTNERGQSPCLVTSALQAACDGGNFNVPALLPEQIYFGPQLGFGNPCTCSTVTYSTAMACGACQGAGINKWSTWMTNCSASEISIGSFPLATPSLVTIPAWAYENVTIHDLWDANEALAIANENQPDSSPIPQPTFSSSGTNASPLSTLGTGQPNSKSSTNIGAIAGGAAGGVVFIILLVVLIFLLRRRSIKNQNGKNKAVLLPPWTPNEQEKFLQPYNIDNNNDGLSHRDTPPTNTSSAYITQPVAPQVAPQQFKPYDPSDPSTFPTTPMLSPGAAPATSHQSLGQPSSGSVRSFQIPYPYNSSNPNVASVTNSSGINVTGAAIPMSLPASHAVLSTRSGQGHAQGQPVAFDPTPYTIGNVSYRQSQASFSQQRGPGGYTGVAEI